MQNKLMLALGLVVTALLAGCSDRVSLADTKMAEIRQQKPLPIKPIPQPEVVPEFSYSAEKMRDPFVATSLLIEAAKAQEANVQPDVTRIKEPLEEYELSQLIYKGSVVSDSGELYGVIQQPDGKVYSVRPGNYLGKNDGRIVEITPLQINLIEIVPDSRGGYVEKTNTINATETN